MAGKVSVLRESGWLHAVFVGCVAYPLGMIASRAGVAEFGAHPIAYTALIMLATGISLMLGSRPGPLGYETLRIPSTWLYGFLNTLVFIFAVSMAGYVSATEVSMLGASTLWVYLLSYMFLGQHINRMEWGGLLMIALPMVILFCDLELSTTDLVQLGALIVLQGLTQAIQKITAERHKTNRAAVSFHQNMRVTAIVMGVTGGIFMFVFMGIAYLKSIEAVDLWPALPNLNDFVNWPMFVTAAFIGLLIRAPSKYCEFYATKKISARYFLAVIALQPLFTFIFESILSGIGFMEMAPLPDVAFYVMAAVITGSVVLAMAGFKKGTNSSPDAQSFILDPASNETVRHTVALTMTFAKGNKLKAAQLLGLELQTLKEILADKKGELQFTRELARRVQRHFADHVAMADPLTGLQNRLQFMTALTQKLKGKAPVNLVLIDLNKFKPVNDTHGHAAGDLVLQLVAKRLKQSAPKNAVVARLGGDEFALFSTAAINTKALSAKLAVPYRTKYGSLTVTASLGMAQSGRDGKTPEALLAAADKRMYGQKR